MDVLRSTGRSNESGALPICEGRVYGGKGGSSQLYQVETGREKPWRKGRRWCILTVQGRQWAMEEVAGGRCRSCRCAFWKQSHPAWSELVRGREQRCFAPEPVCREQTHHQCHRDHVRSGRSWKTGQRRCRSVCGRPVSSHGWKRRPAG
jgi:hypothetical protein